MPQITVALLRKRAEHNEGMLASLEEISLHQEELESINDVLRIHCKKIKILYLQNNIIPKIQNLRSMKDLEYLNLALNNISKIEGLQNCEFLNKLDLTLNFVDVDELCASLEHLAALPCMRDLYMIGNPAQTNWPGFEPYVIAKIPQLQTLDGKEITRSMRIRAEQQLLELEAELDVLAEKRRAEKAACTPIEPTVVNEVTANDFEDPETVASEEMTQNTPEDRVKIYKELAAQKKEKEDRAKASAPRERDYDKEQREQVEKLRESETIVGEAEIKQRNEGGWAFSWDEEKIGVITLDVDLPVHLDSSLIDVDVHPTYVSIIIKSKLLRLRVPSEVKAGESKCQRSKITGHLLVIMPLAKSSKSRVESIFIQPKPTSQNKAGPPAKKGGYQSSKTTSKACDIVERTTKKKSIQEMMLEAAQAQVSEGGDIKNTTAVTTIEASDTVSDTLCTIDTSSILPGHEQNPAALGGGSALPDDQEKLPNVSALSLSFSDLD